VATAPWGVVTHIGEQVSHCDYTRKCIPQISSSSSVVRVGMVSAWLSWVTRAVSRAWALKGLLSHSHSAQRTCTCTPTPNMHAHTNVRTTQYTFTHTHSLTHSLTHTHTDTHTHTHTHTHVQTKHVRDNRPVVQEQKKTVTHQNQESRSFRAVFGHALSVGFHSCISYTCRNTWRTNKTPQKETQSTPRTSRESRKKKCANGEELQ
jgi:carbohydrate-binding DOMON domain-containing protein